MDLQTDAVAESVAEGVAVACRLNDTAACRIDVTSGNSCIRESKCPSSLLRLDLITIVT